MKKLQESLLDDEDDIINDQSAADIILIKKLFKKIEHLTNIMPHKRMSDMFDNELHVNDVVLYVDGGIMQFGVIQELIPIDNYCVVSWNYQDYNNGRGETLDCGDVMLFKDKKYFLNKFVK